MPQNHLAHMVYFKLKDDSEAARDNLVQECRKYLSGHEGTVYFSVGTREPDHKREVNDVGFDVSLNIIFESRAAHDQYQTHERHVQFIEANKATWDRVRVFDSNIVAPG